MTSGAGQIGTAARQAPRRARRGNWWVRLAWIVGPFVPIVLLWEIVVRLGIFSPILLPGPGRVLRTFIEYGWSGELFVHIGESLVRLGLGVLAGTTLGLPLGVAMGMYPRIRRALDPIMNLGQAIPGLAWIPLAILWFGLGYKAVTFIIFTAVFFPVLFATIVGMQSVPQVLVNAGLTMGASRLQIVCDVMLKGALPSIITGVRLGIGYGWRALVGGEMIAATAGLGFLIFDARQYLKSDVVIMGMLTIGIIWVVMDQLLLKPLERRTIERWGLVR
jgi:NitT/TauT family transport system permease protein/taurine transport system permease protein